MKYKETVQLSMSAQVVHKLFRKPELIAIADELDAVPYTDLAGLHTRKIVLVIINHIEEHPFPDTEDCSELLFEFLLNIDYINEDGDYIEPQDRPGDPEEPIDVPVTENNALTGDPECFSFAELRDPSCKACAIFDRCLVERERVRPNCFGKLFAADSEECKGCIEAYACREIVEG